MSGTGGMPAAAKAGPPPQMTSAPTVHGRSRSCDVRATVTVRPRAATGEGGAVTGTQLHRRFDLVLVGHVVEPESYDAVGADDEHPRLVAVGAVLGDPCFWCRRPSWASRCPCWPGCWWSVSRMPGPSSGGCTQ